MSIFTFESQSSKIVSLDIAKFNSQGILEKDLQTAIKHNIAAISPDTLVISEEFGGWDDSKRRIDLLGIDRDGNTSLSNSSETKLAHIWNYKHSDMQRWFLQ